MGRMTRLWGGRSNTAQMTCLHWLAASNGKGPLGFFGRCASEVLLMLSSAANVAMLAVSAADAQRDVLSSMDCRRPCAQRFTQDAGSRAMRGPCFFAKSIKSADLTCVCRRIQPSGSIAEPADAQEASSSKVIEAPAAYDVDLLRFLAFGWFLLSG